MRSPHPAFACHGPRGSNVSRLLRWESSVQSRHRFFRFILLLAKDLIRAARMRIDGARSKRKFALTAIGFSGVGAKRRGDRPALSAAIDLNTRTDHADDPGAGRLTLPPEHDMNTSFDVLI